MSEHWDHIHDGYERLHKNVIAARNPDENILPVNKGAKHVPGAEYGCQLYKNFYGRKEEKR